MNGVDVVLDLPLRFVDIVQLLHGRPKSFHYRSLRRP